MRNKVSFIVLLSVFCIFGFFHAYRYVSQEQEERQKQGLRQSEWEERSEVEIIYDNNGIHTLNLTHVGSNEIKNDNKDAVTSRPQHESESRPDPNFSNPSGQIIVFNETHTGTHSHTHTDSTDSKSAQNSINLTPLQLLAGETLSRGNNMMSIRDPTHTNTPPNTLGAFVHIGKTGGSTLSQMLRNGCHSFAPKPCKDPDGRIRYTKFGDNESAISKLTTYFHVPDFQNRLLKRYASHYHFFLFTLRDPLDRAISSYLYSHPENAVLWKFQAYRKTNGYLMKLKELGSEEEVYKFREKIVKGKHASDVILYDCFPTLQSYADLLEDIENFDDNGGDGNGHENRNENRNKTCANVAKMTMHLNLNLGDCLGQILPGVTVGITHHSYDYNMISYLLASVDFTNKTILVTRTDHLYEDWISANQYLDPYSPASLDDTHINTQRNSSTVDYAVTKELNEGGRKRLCLALKREYHIYLSLLVHAENLSTEEVAQSVEYAKNNCPWLNLYLPPSSQRGGEGEDDHEQLQEQEQAGQLEMFNTLYEHKKYGLCSDHDVVNDDDPI